MADIKVLRQRLEAEISRLEERLRAVEAVEQMEIEFNLNGSGPTRRGRKPKVAISIQDLCKKIVLESGKAWTTASLTPMVQNAGRPDATKENMGTAVRRLAKAGVFEKVSGNRREGFTYRAKR